MLARHSRKPGRWIISAAIALLMMTVQGGVARAQQGSNPPPEMTTPHSQGGGSGVLELPRAPGTQGQPSNLTPSLVPQPGQELEIPSRQLRSQAGYAQVTVTVNDPSGSYVSGLDKDDFRLFVDGQQRSIEFFRRDTRTPVSIGILVDTSGSMHPKIPQARAAIAQFLRNLNSRDDVFLMAFSDQAFLLQPFTTDHSLVMSRLGLLHAFGRTALYDVIADGLVAVERGRYDKKALLVVTDGMDTASRMISLQGVIEEARRRGVLVYSIGIGDPNASSLGLGISIGPLVLGGDDEERVDAKTLQTLSGETGAKTFIIRRIGDGMALRTACEQISLELREQYTVGFLAPDPTRGGYRTVNVEVPAHSDLSVRVRKGVTVGRGTSEAALDPAAPPDAGSVRPAYP
ncbi:MAG: VWA domain-containing protein [Candidatus Binataceae bacterium]